jgi:hypothetical protein
MEYQQLVQDFALRTRANIRIIQKIQKEQPEIEFFEVTQLINSLLGLLIFPQQRYIDRIPEIPLQNLEEDGWPVPKIVGGDYPQVKNLKELIRYLRNAIAHCNIEFISDQNKQLHGLRLWNIRRYIITWKAELTIADIEKLTEKFIDLLLETR